MAKQSAVNLDITVGSDGFTLSGGTTPRSLGITGGNITLTGTGSATLTFPTTSTTIAGLGIAQTFTAQQSFSAGITSAGATLTGPLVAQSTSTFTGLGTFNAGITSAGATFSRIATFNVGITSAGATFTNIISFPNSSSIRIDGSTGSNGQVLSSTGTGITWSTVSSGSGTKTYAVFTPLDNQPPATNYATFDTRNSIAVLDFDATTDESAVFVGIMPEAASLGSGLKVRIHWTAATATTGTCRWGVQFEDMNTDLDSDSFDTATTAGSTTNGTSGIITITEITATSIDSIAAGDPYRLKVYRDADGTSGTDDMAGDAELIVVEVRSAT